jgi:phage-related protein
MNWILWALVFFSLGAPVGSLVIDRIFGIPARTLFKGWGVPSLAAFLIGLIGALVTRNPLAELVLWGIVAGILATIALDIVRLIGVELGAFPMDMPRMFGIIALGLAPQLQRNMIAQMVSHLAELPESQRREMMRQRLQAMTRLPDNVRVSVVSAMQRGLGELPQAKRQAVMGTQMELLSKLPAQDRRTIMKAMDQAMSDGHNPTYAQPRGMPRIPMATFRGFMQRAFPRTLSEAGVAKGTVLWLGYLWHFIIGSTFAITYLLLFGQGSWWLAIGWGIFVWAVMMILMPPMMPMVGFPRWFPVVPFIAHIAMAIPIALIAQSVISPEAAAVSLVAALGGL